MYRVCSTLSTWVNKSGELRMPPERTKYPGIPFANNESICRHLMARDTEHLLNMIPTMSIPTQLPQVMFTAGKTTHVIG